MTDTNLAQQFNRGHFKEFHNKHKVVIQSLICCSRTFRNGLWINDTLIDNMVHL